MIQILLSLIEWSFKYRLPQISSPFIQVKKSFGSMIREEKTGKQLPDFIDKNKSYVHNVESISSSTNLFRRNSTSLERMQLSNFPNIHEYIFLLHVLIKRIKVGNARNGGWNLKIILQFLKDIWEMKFKLILKYRELFNISLDTLAIIRVPERFFVSRRKITI